MASRFEEHSMKTVCALACGVAALAVVGGFAPLGAQNKDSAKFNADKLVGKWNYVSGIKDGTKMDPENLKKQTVAFTKDKVTLQGDGGTFVMKYDLDTAKKPVGIKLEMLESPFGAGAKAAGIIEVTGDDMRFCYAPMSEEAPKAFDAKEGSKLHLLVLKRAK
jgi:uncharacterized protein (TIGR03067 family)